MASQISPLEEIYKGLWVDHARGRVSGLTLMCTSTQGAYLIATLAIFVRLAAGHFWDIICWCWFHSHQTEAEKDGLYHQQQALLRNNLTDARALWHFSLTAWAWRNRVRRPFLRSLPVIIAALVHFVAFAAAGIFSSLVTSAQSNVLISGPTCGWFLQGNGTGAAGVLQQTESQNWWNVVYKRGLIQSSSCHAFNQTEAMQTVQDCKAWGRRFVPYSMNTNVSCPFSPEMCIDGLAVEFTTGTVDSTLDLGINSPEHDRVQLKHRMTCAPITLEGFVDQLPDLAATNISQLENGTGNAYPDWGGYLGYNYGQSLLSYDTSNYTWVWTNYTFGSSLGNTIAQPAYAVQNAMYQDTDNSAAFNTFLPIPQLNATDSDVILFFIAQNQLSFAQPNNDPVFGATIPSSIQVSNYEGVPANISIYSPANPVSVLGCAEQWQYCNPIKSTCTPWTLKEAAIHQHLDYNERQVGVLYRMAGSTTLPEFGVLIANLGNQAILASTAATTTPGAPLPDNQWLREVDHWFSTYWNAVQLFIAGYSVGTGVDNFDRYVTPPTTDEEWMCQAQVVQRSDYLSFNMLGVIIIFAFGVVFMVVNLTIEPISDLIKKRTARRHEGQYQPSAWTRSYTPYLLSTVFEAAGKGEWSHDRSVPTTKQDLKFSLAIIEDKESSSGDSETLSTTLIAPKHQGCQTDVIQWSNKISEPEIQPKSIKWYNKFGKRESNTILI